MTVSRLRHIPGIGVDRMGDRADAAADPAILRLENLDTDLRPCVEALAATRRAIADDDANSYLPFQGHRELRQAAAAHVARMCGRDIDWQRQCIGVAGGLNGITNVLLATLEVGDEVVMTDPIYAGLVNRVHLAGGVPRFAPLVPGAQGWSLDHAALRAAVGPRTRVILTMSPSMPTGHVMTPDDWEVVAEVAERWDLLVLNDAAMERIVFGGRVNPHPASLPGLVDRTVTVGSVSKEHRMIGWRVGWVVGPPQIVADVALVGLTNVVCQVGLAQQAAAAALSSDGPGVAAATETLQVRAARVLDELRGLPVVPPHGGWSLLLDVAELGWQPEAASDALFEIGRVAATPMVGWGPSGSRYVRFVFANEPVDRLTGLGPRVRHALRTPAGS